MSSFVDTDGLVINVFGGIKVNAMENTASLNYGRLTLTNFHSQNKSNVIGQTFGDLDFINQTPVGSPLLDNDVFDDPQKSLQSGAGVQD
ncbi:MAG TPA: hypothetical protein VF095_04505 [Bacillota bacterium]